MTKKIYEDEQVDICTINLPLDVDIMAHILSALSEQFKNNGYCNLKIYGQGESFKLVGIKTKLLKEIEENWQFESVESMKKEAIDEGFRQGQENVVSELIHVFENDEKMTREEIIEYCRDTQRGISDSFS